MTYTFAPSLGKITAVLLVFVLVFSLFSCSEEPAQTSVDESSEPEITLSVDEAKKLLEQDRLITELFVCNKLALDTDLVFRSDVDPKSEYADFANISILLASTYTDSGNQKEFFLSYPDGREPALTHTDGKTTAFYHKGSTYTDFIDMSTVSVEDTETDTEKMITAQTLSQKKVSLKAVLCGEVWLLEKGIFNTNPPESIKGEHGNMLSNLGSFASYSGKILVIELFVDDIYTKFDDASEQQFHEKIKSAFDCITEKTSKYGVSPQIDYRPAYYEHLYDIGEDALSFDIVFAETGFGTLKAFAEANGEKYGYDLSQYDSYVFAVCLNDEVEHSYTVYENTDVTEVYYAEKVFMGTNTTKTQLCKGLLKLLGAYEYNEGLCGVYAERLYAKYFPNDIFLSDDLDMSTISPVTAYTIGATDELNPLYSVFIY